MDATAILQVLSQIAPVGSALTAMIAAVFISRQVANIRHNREVDTLFRIIALADGEKMREAMNWLTYELNRKVTYEEIINDKEAFSKFSRIVHLFETMGVIVSNGYISENLLFDKYGLLIIGAWSKLRHPIDAFREEWRSDEYAENFELLVARYDGWAKQTELKVVNGGERVRLRDGRRFLDYGGRLHERDRQISGSLEQ